MRLLQTCQCIRTALLNNMAEGRQYFSQLEKSLLTKLVRKHKDLVGNKKNDYKTVQQKLNTWEALSKQFNSQSGVTKRDSKQFNKNLSVNKSCISAGMGGRYFWPNHIQ